MDKTLCPVCGVEATGWQMDNNVQSVYVDPDGYDAIGGEFGLPILVGRSGKLERVCYPTRQEWCFLPCGHDVGKDAVMELVSKAGELGGSTV